MTGGFEPRFVVRRADGRPCRPEARYMVLDGGGADSKAYYALRLYALLAAGLPPTERAVGLMRLVADAVQAAVPPDPALAADLARMVEGQWSPALAQHPDAVWTPR